MWGVGVPQSDADGRFAVRGVPAGTYRVRFEPYGSAYLAEWWRDAPTVDEAADVVVTGAGAVDLGTARLAAGGHIRGTVTGPDQAPVRYASVTAFRLVDDEAGSGYRYSSDVYTDEQGRYDLAQLPPGRYRVRFSAWSTPDEGNEEWWDGAATLEDATDIVLRARQGVDDIDAELAPGGAIGGRVTAADGTGIENIRVYVYRKEGARYVDHHADSTDAAGRYEVPALPDGTYRIRYIDDRTGAWAPEWSGDAPDLGSAADVVVADGRLVRRNAVLDPASHLTGSVTGPDGEPMSGVTVKPYVLDAASGRWRPIDLVDQGSTLSVGTDRTGAFDVAGLRAGTYRLGFSSDYGVEAREFWDDVPSVDRATDIVVGVGATSSGLDAQLDDGGHITGRVTDRTGSVLSQVQVDAYTFDPGPGEWIRVSSAYTDDLGRYDLDDLGGGTYRLGFHDVEGVLADEFWRSSRLSARRRTSWCPRAARSPARTRSSTSSARP